MCAQGLWVGATDRPLSFSSGGAGAADHGFASLLAATDALGLVSGDGCLNMGVAAIRRATRRGRQDGDSATGSGEAGAGSSVGAGVASGLVHATSTTPEVVDLRHLRPTITPASGPLEALKHIHGAVSCRWRTIAACACGGCCDSPLLPAPQTTAGSDTVASMLGLGRPSGGQQRGSTGPRVSTPRTPCAELHVFAMSRDSRGSPLLRVAASAPLHLSLHSPQLMAVEVRVCVRRVVRRVVRGQCAHSPSPAPRHVCVADRRRRG